jgi:hypothetical protein
MPFCLIFTWYPFGRCCCIRSFLSEKIVLSSDTTQQDAGIHEVVNSRQRDDAELLDELRRLEEQDKAILEETAAVTTVEDENERR